MPRITNQMIIDYFAYGHREKLSNPRKSLWTENNVLYSYNTAIAKVFEVQIPTGVVTEDHFSVTTSRHTSAAYRAIELRWGRDSVITRPVSGRKLANLLTPKQAI